MTGQGGTSSTPGNSGGTNGRIGDLFDAACPTRLLLDRVGSKWTVMVVLLLAEDELRFGELRRRMPGVSQKMLTRALRQLEDDGLAHRRVEPVSPPAVHYSLTARGTTLVAPLQGLKRWAEENMSNVEESWMHSLPS
ncbi:helix-turn-helix transcriptional regulator [Arthrobacter sp. 24S4-2]|uniref:winged helix-turn-helix transcriptional regulator n=1 Tax=Arthrobacter sp. 24S4-2 TaxID=2575374 RepID=UPI0010C78A3E|nr:helix-turn-helix domain-containing protein [Arthrobacter sp. 24S4-2]QCO98444.1 helix-turn-helix transcriptional regulator [Arthrobacter sp. 24S4-2]